MSLRYLRRSIAIVLFIGFVCSAGCATVKGTASGLAEDTKAAGKGIGNSLGYVWDKTKKADAWFRENYW
ncbi:hypothetical protein ACFL1E_05515 [Candidatus Omnitrophota bacterium]